MTSHETVNRRYSELQSQLRIIFGAEGRGLSEMARALENQLSLTLTWELRAIAHIRNKVVHEGLAEIPRYFEPLCGEALATLKRMKADRKKSPPRKRSEPKRKVVASKQKPAKTAVSKRPTRKIA